MPNSTVDTVAGIKRNDPACTRVFLDYPWTEDAYFPTNDNEWEELGGAIGGNAHLESVELDFTAVTIQAEFGIDNVGVDLNVPPARSLEILCQGISSNRSIERLAIKIRDVDLIETGILESLLPFLEGNQCLRELDLSGTPLGSTGARIICSALEGRRRKNLERVTLGDTNAHVGDGGETLYSLLVALKAYHDLTVLDLYSIIIGQNGLDALLTLLRSPGSKMRELNIGNSEIGDNGLERLATCLADNGVLEKLDLSNSSSVTTAGWTPLTSLLRNSNCKLKSLSLSAGSFNDNVARELATSASSSGTLRSLNLSCNHSVTSRGFVPFSVLFQSLEHLNLNAFGDDAAVAFADAITSNRNALKTLQLGYTLSLRIRGFRAISAMLEHANCQLEFLDICGSNIDDNSAVAFATALRRNRKLKRLHLTRQFSPALIEAFRALLCDPGDRSDINSIVSSNHTLESLGCCTLPGDIKSYLKMNKSGDGCRAKIMSAYFVGNLFSMDPLAQMKAELLVDVLQCFGRINLSELTRRYGHTALFHVLRSQPSLFGWRNNKTHTRSIAGERLHASKKRRL